MGPVGSIVLADHVPSLGYQDTLDRLIPLPERDYMTTRTNDTKAWMKIPNGTKVRLAEGGRNGVIDGVTELVVGPSRNPDGRTQYRVNVGDPLRMLVAQQDLLVLTDVAGLVLMLKEHVEYRRFVTERLRLEIATDRFTVEE
jgi:hypothetical protein